MVRFGPFEVRPATRELFKHGTRIKLPPQAFEVLRIMLERNGELVTRQEFHRVLWTADTFVDFDQGLNNAIKRLREVLNDSAESPRYIETMPRLGYRFIGNLEAARADLPKSDPPNGLVFNSAPGQSNETESVGPVTADRTISSPAKSGWRSLAVVASFAAAVGVGSLLVGWRFRPHFRAPRITGEEQLTADGTQKFGTLATDGRRVYFTEILNGQETVAAVSISGGQVVPLKTPFAHSVLDDISSDRTDLLIADSNSLYDDAPLWRVPIIGGTPRRLGNILAHDATWSPDGEKLAYAVGDGLFLADADGSDPRTLLAPRAVSDEWVWRPMWSPDGQRLRFDYYNMDTHGSQIWEVDVDGNNAHALFTPSPDCPMQAFGNWAPDGKYYFFSCWKDLESGIPWPASNLWVTREKGDLLHRPWERPERLTIGPTRHFAYTVGLDGKTVFALASIKHGELMRYDQRTNAFSLFASGLSAEGISFSRDGKWVAFVRYPQGELWRSRVDGSEPLQLSSRPLFASTPAWSPDGKKIAFNGARAGERSRVYLVSADGGDPRPIQSIRASVDPTWLPDGRSLAFLGRDSENGIIRILDLKTGSTDPVAGSEGFWAPRTSPNGDWIVALSNNLQRLLLFDRETRTWRELAGGGLIEWPQWSRDSQFVYFERVGTDREILRVGVGVHSSSETVLSLKNLRTTGVDPAWFSLAPDGSILLLHDTGGGTEIYSLFLDEP